MTTFISRQGKKPCFRCGGIGKVNNVVCKCCGGYGSITLRKLEQMRRRTNERGR